MNILVYSSDQRTREAIARHLVEVGNFQLFFAATGRLIAPIALQNDIHVTLLFDPSQTRILLELKDFLKTKRPKMRVRILSDAKGLLLPDWRLVVTAALAPPKQRQRRVTKVHPRFKWKPTN